MNFLEVAKQLLDALNYLHNVLHTVHGLITLDSLVWSDDTLKLAHWPINLLTNSGVALGVASILPTDKTLLAPELVSTSDRQASPQSDTWSAGLALLKLMKPTCKIPDNPCRLAYCGSAEEVIEKLEGHFDEDDDLSSSNSSMWNSFFTRIFNPDPERRATLEELYSILGHKQKPPITNPFQIPIEPNLFETQQAKIFNLNISEIYYLWRLSFGRNFESEQKQDDCPPIFRIPYLILTEKQVNQVAESYNKPQSHTFIDTKAKLIPLDRFKDDINRLDTKIFHPLILTCEETFPTINRKLSIENGFINRENNNNKKIRGSLTFADLDNLSIQSNIQNLVYESPKFLPIVIKEADFAYQCERIMLFKRLVHGCPFLKEELRHEASIDIPPYYRAKTWATLLDVSASKSKYLYETIDKTTPIATDRQISVDIPRCHQYNELMASPQGHQKLARILKAWLNYNRAEYVYWQGLDSLAAPFLLLNFDNEALAFGCFDAFVNKYLRGFFRKDNQLIVQQYLSMFSELLSYHDNLLATHLEKLNFLPDLYAIPWFLTMFTHVLPLHKVLHVWDCLILGDERFPLCIGLAILNQLRKELLEYNFNDCIVAFSDLPEIDIEKCIKDASHYYNSTPDKLINFTDIREFQ